MFRSYKNKYRDRNRIYSLEELSDMSLSSMYDNKDEYVDQFNSIGLPTEDELEKSPYTRKVTDAIDVNGDIMSPFWETYEPDNISTFTSTQNDISARNGILKSGPSIKMEEVDTTKKMPQEIDESFAPIQKPTQNASIIPSTADIILSTRPKWQDELDKILGIDRKNTKTQNIQTPDIFANYNEFDKVFNVEQIPKETKNSDLYPKQEMKVNSPETPNNQVVKTDIEKPSEKKFELKVEKNGFSLDMLKDKIKSFIREGKENLTLENIKDNIINEIYNMKEQNTNKKTVYERLQEDIYKKYAKFKYPMSAEATQNGMDDMKAAKQNPNAVVYNSYENISNKDVRDKFKELKIPKDAKGVEYDITSKESQKIVNSPEMEQIIKETLNGKKVTAVNFGGFNDLKFSIQHATVVNPKIENGEFTCQVVDFSDFEKRKPKGHAEIPNNWGYQMQKKGYYKNYFTVYNIRKKI